MTTLSIKLPESLHKSAKRLSSEDKISINQFIASALAQKIAAIDTQNYLQERAAKGTKNKYLETLSKVKKRTPITADY
ncbi:MAG: toxin-antitoxin system HicB family antitoxin [Gammaproteobacteria bacterium]|nr:MAG: toxin-antitoxin system HicB family antitoxin [Gammaproteobacteria bacterium]